LKLAGQDSSSHPYSNLGSTVKTVQSDLTVNNSKCEQQSVPM